MGEPKPLASLSAGLLARKGAARPAMRRQPLGSGPAVLVLQIMVNTVFLVLPLTPTMGGELTYLAYSITYLVAAVTVFALFGPRPLFGQPSVAKENTPELTATA